MSFLASLQNYKNTVAAPQTTESVTAIKEMKYHKLWYELEEHRNKLKPSCEQGSGENNAPFKLALLFIIIDELPNELIWRLWLHNHASQYRIFIHAKFPDRVTSPFVREHLVRSFQCRPNWGSLELTQTMIAMLYEAYTTDSSITHFVFLSESCLPIVSFITLRDQCDISPPKSYLYHRNTPNNGYSKQQQFDVLENRIPKDCVHKADQWCVLTRSHVTMLFDCMQHIHTLHSHRDDTMTTRDVLFNPLFDLFVGLRASDEMFLPTVFSILHLLNEENVENRQVTYSDWTGTAKSPNTFPALTMALYENAMKQHSWFVRKIQYRVDCRDDSSVREWMDRVYGSSGGFDENSLQEVKVQYEADRSRKRSRSRSRSRSRGDRRGRRNNRDDSRRRNVYEDDRNRWRGNDDDSRENYSNRRY